MNASTKILCLYLVAMIPAHVLAHSRMAAPTPEEKLALDAMNVNTPVQELVSHIASNSYHVGRAASVVLRKIKNETAIPGLIDVASQPLTSENKYAAYNAVLTLCVFESTEARKAIRDYAVDVARHFSNEMVLTETELQEEESVARAFCRTFTHGLSPEKASEALASQMDTAPNWVLGPLVEIGAAAVPVLTRIVEDVGSTPSTRVQALRGLAKLKSPLVAPLLKRIMNASDDDPLFSNSSQLIGEASAALIAVDKQGLKTVQDTFRSRKAWLSRLYMMRSLSEVSDSETQRWLEEVYSTDGWTADTEATRRLDRRIEAIKNHALLSAKRIQVALSNDRVSTLIALLAHDHDWVRAFASEQMVGSQDRRILEPAIAHLGDSDSRVRRFLLEALGLLGDQRASAPLIRILTGGDIGDQVPAKRALEGLGYSVIYAFGMFHAINPNEPLLSALLSETPEQHEQAITGLIALGSEGGIRLTALLQSNDGIRRKAGEQVKERVRRIAGSDEATAGLAIDVLSGMGDLGAGELLEVIRKVKSDNLRKRASDGIAKAGRGAVPLITASINFEKNVDVPWMPFLFRALAFSGRTGRFVLKQHATGENEKFRDWASTALAQYEASEAGQAEDK